MDLSLDVEQNSSVSACLRNFSSTETLTKKNKFFCESCHALQVRQHPLMFRLRNLCEFGCANVSTYKYTYAYTPITLSTFRRVGFVVRRDEVLLHVMDFERSWAAPVVLCVVCVSRPIHLFRIDP